ncbi:AmmeMemoRadiSam system radical SAM enzyme [Candidatus Marinamargulisbacteria bacterium SCGC AG-414-C22]|nr:AmmeMemoRadiSam system radical SAM enzyme [Candidatus Marinamargulisbacteria bacterium SCGC AG-414-C22]
MSKKSQVDYGNPAGSVAFPGRYWHAVREGKIKCDLCPRGCVIGEGQRGFCFVRQNQGDEMVLTTYGRSSGFCIDPIEKKPLNHFYPGQPILSFGTAGCNLGCKFCQNWDISTAKQMDRLQSLAYPEKIATVAQELGCVGVAFTYNDPVIFAEYAIDIAKECRKKGLKTVAVTAGYIGKEARVEFYDWMDAANVDLKAFTQTFYKKCCLAHLEPVLDTLKYLKHHTSVWFEITNLVIPTHNDDWSELHEMTTWIMHELGPDVPLHFTSFHPDYKMMDTPQTPSETLLKARDIALNNGLHYVYTGNMYGLETASTYCHHCKNCIIERDWYELGAYHITNNQCGFCNADIPGVFTNHKGEWGRRRKTINL